MLKLHSEQNVEVDPRSKTTADGLLTILLQETT